MKKTLFILLLLGTSLIGHANVIKEGTYTSPDGFVIDVTFAYCPPYIYCEFSSPENNYSQLIYVECSAATWEPILPIIYDLSTGLPTPNSQPGQADFETGSSHDIEAVYVPQGVAHVYLDFRATSGEYLYSCMFDVLDTDLQGPTIELWEIKY